MSFRINFTHLLNKKIPTNGRASLFTLRITKEEYKEYTSLISKSIDKFNSEIEWDDMWDLYEAELRLNTNQILYLLMDSYKPIGHVWYKSDYLYNAFVSNERRDGDSAWFIQKTMWDMKQQNNIERVNLYVDDWNERAIKFWEKLGYIKLT